MNFKVIVLMNVVQPRNVNIVKLLISTEKKRIMDRIINHVFYLP